MRRALAPLSPGTARRSRPRPRRVADQRGALFISVLTSGVQTSPSARNVERPADGALDLERRGSRRTESRGRSRTRVVVDEVVAVGAHLGRDRQRPVEQGQAGGAADAIVVVAEQDRVGGAARQALVGGVDAREQRHAAGLLERQQAGALDRPRRSPRGTMIVATSNGARRSMPAEDRLRCRVAAERAGRQQQRARAERERAAARDARAGTPPCRDSDAAAEVRGQRRIAAGIVGRIVAAETDGDRTARRRRATPGRDRLRSRARRWGWGRRSRSRPGSRARPANATPIRRRAAAGRGAPPPCGASGGPRRPVGSTNRRTAAEVADRAAAAGSPQPMVTSGAISLSFASERTAAAEQRRGLGAAVGRRGQHQQLRVAQQRAPLEQGELVGSAADRGAHRPQAPGQARHARARRPRSPASAPWSGGPGPRARGSGPRRPAAQRPRRAAPPLRQ